MSGRAPGTNEDDIARAVAAALRERERGKSTAHDWIKSGWTIAAACIAVGTLLFNVGQFVQRVESPPQQVKVQVPDHIRQELAACRALALVVTRRNRDKGR